MNTSQTHTYKNNDELRYHQKILLDLIRESYSLNYEGKILDIGCANGIFLKNFNKKFRHFHSTGVDTSKNMIILSKKNKIPNSKFIKKDFMNLENKSCYDIVVASGVLAFYDNFTIAINKMISLLKNNSYLYIFGTFNSENIDTVIKFRNNYTKSGWEKGLNSFSIKTISSFLKKKKLRFQFKKFNLPINLKKKKNPIISYTLNNSKKKNIVLNGANIRMELFHLIIRKQ